jgi:galactitol-specific phosphotransferase system IIB component
VVTAAFLPVNLVFKFVICGMLSVIFLIFYWFQYKMEYSYFYFSNNGNNLIFRFYSLRHLYGKPKTIEISKMNFVKYDIVTSFFDKKDLLVLYQKTPRGVAKYPPISLTLLSKNKKTELKRALFAIIQ